MIQAAGQLADQRDADVLAQVRHQALRTSVAEMARTLVDILSPRIAAYVVGVKDLKTLSRWSRGQTQAIRQDNEACLRTAYEIVTLLLRFEQPDTVRAWFIGMAPELGDVSPARAMHEGRTQDAIGAARAFVAHG